MLRIDATVKQAKPFWGLQVVAQRFTKPNVCRNWRIYSALAVRVPKNVHELWANTMQLTVEQSRKALAEHGCYVTEACDRCGRLLGAVRYTIRGTPGEWCSELCRDGEKAVALRQKGGRPAKYRDAKQRSKANARYQREFRHRQDVRKTPSQPTGTERVANAILSFGYTPTSPTIAPVPQGSALKAASQNPLRIDV